MWMDGIKSNKEGPPPLLAFGEATTGWRKDGQPASCGSAGAHSQVNSAQQQHSGRAMK